MPSLMGLDPSNKSSCALLTRRQGALQHLGDVHVAYARRSQSGKTILEGAQNKKRLKFESRFLLLPHANVL